MNVNTSIPNAQPQKSNLRSAILKRFIQVAFVILIYAAILFMASGRLDWGAAWVYIGVYFVTVVVNGIFILPRDPDLIAERGQVKEGTKGWDTFLGTVVAFLGPVLIMIVAGLDVRLGWSPQLALGVQLAGLLLVILGYGLFSWAMASNRFFSGMVRIQNDRGHTVATTGPYRIVRHPGYLGLGLYMVGMPLLFAAP